MLTEKKQSFAALYPWYRYKSIANIKNLKTLNNNSTKLSLYGECSFCSVILIQKPFNLKRHAESSLHKKNTEKVKLNNKIVNNGTTEQCVNSKKNNVDSTDKIVDAEVPSGDNDDEELSKIMKMQEAMKAGINQLLGNFRKEKEQYITKENQMNGQVWCKACESSLFDTSQVIERHFKTLKHQVNTNKLPETVLFDPEVATLQLQITALVADSDLSFIFGEKLIKFLKQTSLNTDTFNKMCLDRKTIPAIMKKLIAPEYKERLGRILEETDFSVMIDESTDINEQSFLCILVRYADPELQIVQDVVWDLIPVHEGSPDCRGTAKHLANGVIASFNMKQRDHVISFCSDTCNLMMGQEGGVQAIIRKTFINCSVVKCQCHVESLITSRVMEVFPEEIRRLSSSIHNYIGNSSLRSFIWSSLQNELGFNNLQIVRPCSIRWLSLYQAILRLLRRWPQLVLFFESQVSKNEKKGELMEMRKYLQARFLKICETL
ncbi:protein FAM200B-like [Phymastichus coffea]|uniref:protein FAM200B-like n=1 Tax=Phymastichus coffea TaxID=108790 RepID=UPI00273AC420|nr:protein FAM200B-like [Phymastichus coffea]